MIEIGKSMSNARREQDGSPSAQASPSVNGSPDGMSTSNAAGENMIVFQGVSKHYGSAVALHETDLAVRKGEFLSLLGPSGSGKSTILNVIAGAVAPSSGKILLDGKDVSAVPPRERKLGMVFQNYALLPHLNVLDNVAFPLRIRGVDRSEIQQRVRSALDRVGLTGYDNRKPHELSGGQQQRVGIARCIIYSPSVILMDEPLGALDKKLRDQLQGEIKRLHRDLGTTLVYVTHDQEEALNLSDRVCLMNGGRIVQLGTPDELYFEPVNEFVADFVGESNLLEGIVQSRDTVLVNGSWELKVQTTEGHSHGSKVKVLVRPEKITVLEGETTAAARREDMNECTGVISQISFVGRSTCLELTTTAGVTLLVETISTRAGDRSPIGRTLTVRWAARHSTVLKK